MIWSSEGSISQGIQPFVRKATLDGAYISEITVPNIFKVDGDLTTGPRNNGVFEGLSRNFVGQDFWVALELPIIQDGEVPTSRSANAPTRISSINNATSSFENQYAYELDKVARPGLVEVNGITEILSYDENKLLVLERSYAAGYNDGGNDIKLYTIDVSDATDIRDIASLKETPYTPVQKTLLLDFDSLRGSLTDGIVDNIEGMSFGPLLENGKRSLVVISDNNFSSFGPQLTQLIVFQVD